MGPIQQRLIRGGRLVKTARGVLSLAAVVGFGMAGSAAAQGLDCISPPVGGPEDSEICDLGTLTGGDWSWAVGVSADGSVVVGRSDSSAGGHAFRWVEGAGMEDLGTLEGGSESVARGVSADGSVVVGESSSGRTGNGRAFRWVEGAGMEDLGILAGGGWSSAYGVNADGSVVVGRSDSSAGWRAFRWVEGAGMEDLGTLSGGDGSTATGVNADGSVVVGYSGGGYVGDDGRAFIWRGVMEDYENLITSFPVLGNDSAVMQAEQQFALGTMMKPGALAQAGGWSFSAQLGAQSTGRNPTKVGARTTSLAALSFGRGISDSFTLGATISAQGSSLKNNAFDMDTGFAGAIWGTYSQGGADRTGLQASASLGYARNSGDISRGRLLTDVVLATGKSNVKTRAVQMSLGYGMTQGAWLVTPSLGVAHYDTTRAAYTETGAAFNASYDAMTTRRTVATLAVAGDMTLSDQGRLSLGAGVERDLSVTAPRLTGTSDIPGLATFDISSTSKTNRTRGFVTAGYTHDFGNGHNLSGTVRVGRAVYGSTQSVGVGLNYGMRF